MAPTKAEWRVRRCQRNALYKARSRAKRKGGLGPALPSARKWGRPKAATAVNEPGAEMDAIEGLLGMTSKERTRKLRWRDKKKVLAALPRTAVRQVKVLQDVLRDLPEGSRQEIVQVALS